jgi:fibronectin-binding autotransporter adhesin
MTFAHTTGVTPVLYRFTNSAAPGDFTDSASAIVSANTPFGTNAGTVLTLDTGFLGTVVLRARSNAANTGGNTIVRKGILEISDGGALPHNNNQNQPPLTLDGGEFRVNVNTQGNTNPAAAQLGGTLTVLSNSTISNGETTRTPVNQGASVWNGPVTMGAGITLTLKSYTDVRLNLSNMNISGVLGTIRLADDDGVSFGTDGVANTTVVGVNNQTSHDAVGALFDLGTGNSEVVNTGASLTYDWGALTGGANTKISGSPTTAGTGTFSIGARGDSTTFAGIFRDSPTFPTGLVALTKVGTGTLTLTGNSTHTGATTVSGGTLTLSGASGGLASSASTPVTVNSNATLRLDNATTNSNDRLGTAGVTLNQGNLVFVGNLPASTNEVAGVLNIAGGANTVQSIASGAGGPANITFANLARTGGVVNFQPAAGANINITGPLTLTGGIIGAYATVDGNDWATLVGTKVTANSVYATDTAAGTWATGQNINKTLAGTETVTVSTPVNTLRISNGSVSITAPAVLTLEAGGVLVPGTNNPSITGTGSLTAGTTATATDLITNVVNAGNTLTISAPITNNGAGGAVKLVKAGAGKLLLSGTGSTYSGGTEIVGGTLQVGVANFFPAGSNLTINYGTAFDIGGFNQSFGTVALIDGSLLNSGGGGASVTATTAYDVRNGTISTPLGGAAALTKTSAAGTVTLTGANTYTGGTIVSNGTLVAGATNTLPSGQAVTVNGGGTLNIGAFNQSVGAVIVGNTTTSAGTISGTTGFLTATSYDLQNGTVSANLAGAGVGVTKAGINTTVTLSGNSTYTGPTSMANSANSGTLVITSLANGGQPSAIGASSSAAANLSLGGGTLSYTGTGHSTDRLFSLTGNQAVSSNGTGPISFTGTGEILSNGGNLTLSGSNTGQNVFAPLLLQSNNILQLTKSGAGTWVLTNNANSFTGNMSITGGVLSVAALANSGQPSPIGAGGDGTLILNGGTLRYTGTGHSTNRQVTLTGSGGLDASGTGPVTFANTGNLAGPGTGQTLTLTGTNTGNNTLASNIVSNVIVTKTGAGSWRLSGANTYTGATTVSGGTLVLDGNQTTTASVTVSGADAKLVLNNNGTSNRVLKTGAVTVSSGGRLDLKDNKLITTTTPGSANQTTFIYSGLQGLVQSAYNFQSWDQPGLTTSMPAAQSGLTTIGITTGAARGGLGATDTDTFAGQTINGASTIAMYTYAGDGNLDGVIDGGDYGIIDNNVQIAGANGYFNGDFNYDGVIDGGDYGIIDNNIQAQGAPFPVSGAVSSASAAGGLAGVTAVPEPASLSLVGLAAASLLGRRRRRAK